MMYAPLTRLMTLFSVLALASAPALAADAQGVWLRADGAGKVKIGPCGDSLCGVLIWLRDPDRSPGKIGERVFYDMKPDGQNTWSGSAYNPEDGRNYSGKMELAGNALVTTGCALGGLICRSLHWTRSR